MSRKWFFHPQWSVLFLILLVMLAYTIRVPYLHKDFFDIHGWKNIRHYQFAENMIKLRNPIVGICTFTQPEAGEPWIHRVTESPWVDWSLVAAYLMVKQSITVFRLTFLAVNLLTIVMAYYLFQHCLRRRSLALLLSLIFATTPMVVGFSTHGIGENFIYAGQLLFVLTVWRLFARFSLPGYIQFCLTLFYLIFCKVTTGFVLAYAGFFIVHLCLFARHWRAFAAFMKMGFWIKISLAVLYFGVPTLALIYFIRLGSDEWALDSAALFNPKNYSTLIDRTYCYFGLPIFAGTLVSIAGLAVMGLVATARRRDWRIEPYEAAVACLLFCVLANFLIQVQPLIVHEYYLNVYCLPLLLIMMLFLRRLTAGRGWRTLAIAGVVVGAAWAASVPSAIAYTRFLNHHEFLETSDRELLKNFFEPRIQSQKKKVFIIARSPYEAYAANVNMILRWNWENVAGTLADTNSTRKYLGGLGLRYVVVFKDVVPDKVMAGLDESPLVDLGPKHYRLGLVHRGKKFLIFKITRGIEKDQPVQTVNDPSAWFQYGDQPFAICKPFVAQGDVLAFEVPQAMPGQYLECLQGDRRVFQCRPEALKASSLYTYDLQPHDGRPLTMIATHYNPEFARTLRLRAIKYSDPW